MQAAIDLLRRLDFTETALADRHVPAQTTLNEFTRVGASMVMTMLAFGPGERRATHTHEELRLTFVRAGHMRLILPEQVIEADPGAFVSILPGVPHSLEVLGAAPLHLAELIVPFSTTTQKEA